jgi:hypothetical protein
VLGRKYNSLSSNPDNIKKKGGREERREGRRERGRPCLKKYCIDWEQ